MEAGITKTVWTLKDLLNYQMEKIKMAYRLLAADSLSELNKQVNELLKAGWELYGFPIVNNTIWVSPDGNDNLIREYCQALIGEESEF